MSNNLDFAKYLAGVIASQVRLKDPTNDIPIIAELIDQELAERSTPDNIKNDAWFNVLSKRLGSTQLSHALAKLESLEKASTPTAWIRTSKRPPTAEDCDIHDLVLSWRHDEGNPDVYEWKDVAKFHKQFLYWLPIPALPAVEAQGK